MDFVIGSGWNGAGRQSASTALPGEVKVGPDGITGKVDVRVLVTPYSKASGEWTAAQIFPRGKAP